MPNYAVTYKCGHVEFMNLKGTLKEEKDFIESKKEKLCHECYLKESMKRKIEAKKEAMQRARDMKLPDLLGGRYQDIEDGNYYRMKFLDHANKALQDIGDVTITYQYGRMDKEFLSEVISYAMKEYTTADFWIKHSGDCLSIYTGPEYFFEEKLTRLFITECETRNDIGELLLVKPEGCTKTGIVTFKVKNNEIYINYQKDKDFISVIKSCFCEWDGDTWVKHLDEYSGSFDDRIANIGYHLLNKGFCVRFMSKEQRSMALNRTYEPEKTRIVTISNNDLALKWKGYSDILYKEARKIVGSKWNDGMVVVPVSSSEKVKTFAENYGFFLTPEANELIEKSQKTNDSAEKEVVKKPAMSIREIRERSGLTKTGFARKYGIPQSIFDGWEIGETTPAPYIRNLLERVVREDYPKKWEEYERNQE